MTGGHFTRGSFYPPTPEVDDKLLGLPVVLLEMPINTPPPTTIRVPVCDIHQPIVEVYSPLNLSDVAELEVDLKEVAHWLPNRGRQKGSLASRVFGWMRGRTGLKN